MCYYLYRVSSPDGTSFESIVAAEDREGAMEVLNKTGYGSAHIICELKSFGLSIGNPHRDRIV